MEHKTFISADILCHNFAAKRAKYLHLIKNSFDYVFHTSNKTSDESLQLRASLLEEFHSCNYQVDDTIFDNSTLFILTILDIENYWCFITDSSNKQIVYANPSAKVFLYDPDRKQNFCKNECDLLNQLVNLDLKQGIDHHISLECHVMHRNLSSDSFAFNWNGRKSILHFVSDDTNHVISTMKHATTAQQEELLARAYIDSLTNTYNRRYAFDRLNHYVYDRSYFSVVLLNISNLTYINDHYGNDTGDAHLQHMANLLRSIVRDTDILARIGGDDFLMIFPICTEIDAIAKMRMIRSKMLESTTYNTVGISYAVKELTPANILELSDIIDELYKKMNFYKQLQCAKQHNLGAVSNHSPILVAPAIQEDLSNNISLDYNFKIPNFTQYEIDKEILAYDKLCVVRVENADLNIAISGSEHYYQACKEILPKVLKRMDSTVMNLYAFDYKTFLIGCVETYSSDKFLMIMRKFCDRFGYAIADTSDLTGILRFAVVSESENPVETALALLIEHQNDHGNFFVYDKTVQNLSLNEESTVIQVIRNAIVNHQIVAYYQGIRNNKTGFIDTYEALMRIVGEDGTVYTPYHFLDIAKKYKLYEKLTYLMIERVLGDFRNRTERISINVVTSDIKSVQFRNWFYKRLDEFPNPKRIILEIVESEEYSQDDELTEFIERLRSYGVMIAIDDFGSGYSNLGKIINLKPDIIKIDGSIIQNICVDMHSQQVLDVIVSMSKILDAYVVAEYIENEEIQAIVDRFQIACSQGFLYSKPTPIEQLPPPIDASNVSFSHLN